MKSIIAIIIVYFLCAINSNSQSFEEVATVKIDTKKMSKEMQYQSTQFVSKKKKRTDFVYTFNIHDIIKPYLKKINQKDYNSLVFVFVNERGESISSSFQAFDQGLTNIPALLIYKPVTVKVGDSISLQEAEGDIDLSELDEAISHFSTRNRIGLQIKKLSKVVKEKITTDATIIFPNDLTTSRWISNIVEIRIYQFSTVNKQ